MASFWYFNHVSIYGFKVDRIQKIYYAPSSIYRNREIISWRTHVDVYIVHVYLMEIAAKGQDHRLSLDLCNHTSDNQQRY